MIALVLNWLLSKLPDDLFDVDLTEDEPSCWMCDGPAVGSDVLGMWHCLDCYEWSG